MSNDYKRIMRDGIWNNNVVFSQLLALCPLLAVTSTATTAAYISTWTMGKMPHPLP